MAGGERRHGSDLTGLFEIHFGQRVFSDDLEVAIIIQWHRGWRVASGQNAIAAVSHNAL